MKPSRSRSAWLTTLLVWLALPPAWLWVWRHERRICHRGRTLTDREREDAAAAGVSRPEAIRLLLTRPVPTPGGPWLRCLGRITRFPMEPPAGMALGHGIYLDPVDARGRPTFVHECVHVAQYERLGGKWAFLRQYLEECIGDSYWGSEMEAEANRIADDVCSESD